MPTVQLLFVKKGSRGAGIPTEEVMRIFETETDLEKIKAAVEQASERLYVSWASVDVVDNAHERIRIEEVASNQDVLLERGGPITDEHTNRVIGQTLGYKIMQHPTEKLGILHLNKIFGHNSLDDQVWDEIASGKRKGSSVGGFNENQTFEMMDDGPVRVLEGFRHMETASVFEPCNPLALNEAVSVVAKSAKVIKTKKQSTINKGWVRLAPGQKPPEGAQVKRGPKGGQYYNTAGTDPKKPEATSQEAVDQIDEATQEPETPEQPPEQDDGYGTDEEALMINEVLDMADKEEWQQLLEKVEFNDGLGDLFVENYTDNYNDPDAIETLEREIGLEINWKAVNEDRAAKGLPPVEDPVLRREETGTDEEALLMTDDYDTAAQDGDTTVEEPEKAKGGFKNAGSKEIRDTFGAETYKKALTRAMEISQKLADESNYDYVTVVQPSGISADGKTFEFEVLDIADRSNEVLLDSIQFDTDGDEQSPAGGKLSDAKKSRIHKSVIKKEKQRTIKKHIFKKKTTTGELTMDKDVKKAFSDLNARLDKIEKAQVKKEDQEEEKEEEEVEKAAETSTDGGVNLAGEEKPEDERPEEENQLAVVKAELEETKKALAEAKKKLTPVEKTQTARPADKQEVKKKEEKGIDAVAIARGEVKKTWAELNAENKAGEGQ